MKTLAHFTNCLNVLKKADFEFANENDIYRVGILEQFHLTFEMARRALQAVLLAHGVSEAKTGFPRELLRLGYRGGFVSDASICLLMIKYFNIFDYIFDEDATEDMLLLIHDSFIPALVALEETLRKKLEEAEGDWHMTNQ